MQPLVTIVGDQTLSHDFFDDFELSLLTPTWKSKYTTRSGPSALPN